MGPLHEVRARSYLLRLSSRCWHCSYFNYGFEALCVNEFGDKPYADDVLDEMVCCCACWSLR